MVLGIGVSWGILSSAVGKILFQWDQVTSKIEINRQDRTLDITAIGFGNDEVFHYSLDGWTGRYSMPLEFLLSTHIATMAPDLSYKLATTFNTDVEILLWKSKSNSLTGGISQDGGETVPYKEFVNSELNAKKRAAIIFRKCPSLHSLIRGENDGDSDYWCTNDNCSDKLLEDEEMKETCQGCANFVELLTRAAYAVGNSGEKFDTFVPYINSVTDHWFRNVYFTYGGMKQYAKDNGVEIPDVVVRDEEYYLSTGEMWTEYEMTADGSDYELYVYLPTDTGDYTGEFALNGTLVCIPDDNGPYSVSEKAGNMYDKKGNGGYGLYVVSGSGKNKKYDGYKNSDGVEEFRVGKKAKTETKQDENWNVYSLDKNETGEGKWEIYTGDGSDYIKEARKLRGVQILYNLITLNGTVTQVEDGVRGETNVQTKKLFLDDYYLYDGSGPRAALIEAAKTKADSDDPDSFKEQFGTEEIKATYKGKSYTATIDDISGPINILQNSLTAFSILRNMHTLDAEYIYHDFKELVVELDYFDKEDLIESEREVMMFPISGLSSAGWPVTRYDKSEEFYGTLIHSAKDYETLKLRTSEELAELGVVAEDPEGSDESEVQEDVNNNETENSEGYSFTPTGNRDWGTKTGMLQFNGKSYETWKQTHNTCTLYAFAFIASAYTDKAFDYYIDESNTDYWNGGLTGSSWSTAGVDGEKNKEPPANDADVDKIFNALNEGKLVFFYSGFGSSAGHHAIVLLGETTSGKLLYYNPGKADAIFTYGGSSNFRENIESLVKNGSRAQGGHLHWYFIPSGVPNGVTKSSSSFKVTNFDGYEGGEPVLAPVTGEVIKYGTVKRKNLETGKEDDEVGFIKIRVLGNQEALPGSTCNYFGDDNDKKGYNYFWEEYTEASITNHVLYIEGFDVSKVLGGEGASECGVDGPNIAKLRDYIKQEDGKDDDGECNYTTEYKVPDLAEEGLSQKEKDKRQEKYDKEKAKKEAKYTIEVSTPKSKKIYIKEGAVIGHTYTEDQADMKDGVGNYMRLIFRDADDQVVENVEHYMELEKPKYATVNGEPVYVESSELEFMAGVLTAECGGVSEEGMTAAAWVIRNRVESGRFGSSLAEILVAPNQFTVVATTPEGREGDKSGGVISIEVNGTTYYVKEPTDKALEIAQKVMNGELANPIEGRMFWKARTYDLKKLEGKDPIQIPPGTGNWFHY